MKLTVEILKNAAIEADKKDGAVYVIEQNGEPNIIVNSAGASAVRIGNVVLQHIAVEEIKYNNLIYKNEQLSLQEFCDKVNKKYA